MKLTLGITGLFGILLFGLFFSLTFLSPKTLEDSATGFIKKQIAHELNQTFDAFEESAITSKAKVFSEKLGIETKSITQKLKDGLPEKIARVLAAMCGYDCEKKKAIASSITSDYLERLLSIQVAQKNLSEIIKGKYLEIVENLKVDLRIFLGSNFTMFLILLLISFAKPRAIEHLFLPAILLLIATIISVSIYLFGQDWFYTIVYNDYMGIGYLAYIAAIFGLLIDIGLNKARITSEIINTITNAIGSAFSVVPC